MKDCVLTSRNGTDFMWMDNWVLNQPFRNWPEPQDAPSHHRVLFRFFETQRNTVVLSSSNTAQREAFESVCQALDVPILQRRGGGGTVLLGPGCLVLTFAFFAKDVFSNQRYFSLINGIWADAMADAGISGMVTRGHSDLAVGDRKIAGTSLFRRKHLVVYQGSLLVDPDFELMRQVLQHPSREPDYRLGRSHREFLVSARELGYQGSTRELAGHCSRFFRQHASGYLFDDFADLKQIPEHQFNFS
jgi:lipoate-protein ligase A